MTDDNGDNWRLGVHQRVLPPTGTLNTAGSTITKVFGDGREVVYLYNVAQARYVSTEGDTAHDTLQSVSGTWTWTDGNVTYTTTYAYDGSSKRIASITQKDGSSVGFTYELVNGQYRVKTYEEGYSPTNWRVWSEHQGSCLKR